MTADRLTHAADVLLSRRGTVLISLALFMVGLSTTGISNDDLPGRDGIVVLCFAGATAGIVAALVLKDRLSVAHEAIGVVTMVVSVTRGVSFSIRGQRRGTVASLSDFFLDYPPPWFSLFVFVAGMMIWAYGRQESDRRRLNDRRG